MIETLCVSNINIAVEGWDPMWKVESMDSMTTVQTSADYGGQGLSGNTVVCHSSDSEAAQYQWPYLLLTTIPTTIITPHIIISTHNH